MGDGDATSVVPFLKALSLEILLGFGTAGDGGFKGGLFQWWCKVECCRLANFMGIATLVRWPGLSHFVGVTASRGPLRLALLDNRQCCVG